jgi:hypothetical protein
MEKDLLGFCTKSYLVSVAARHPRDGNVIWAQEGFAFV